MAMDECGSLHEVRERIDGVDREIVRLLAERGRYVEQAVRFKRNAEDVRAPARVEQVIAKVRAQAVEYGADPALVEHVYRAMIAWFVDSELRAPGRPS